MPSVLQDANSSFNVPLKLSKPEQQHLFDGSCSVIASTSSMKMALKDAFREMTRQERFELADPAERFQATDVVTFRGLPSRRLVFAGVCENRCFIHYEHGGIADRYELLIFRADSKGALKPVWGASGLSRAKNVDELRSAIASGTFPDEPANYW